MDLTGIGPAGASRLLVADRDITRFPDKAHFASWTGTATIDASSGGHVRHRLSRSGNPEINWVLHTMAIVRLRHGTALDRQYYDKKRDSSKTTMEARRCLE
ncbi:IS110 family transposase [Cutibacterium avidum]|uniref:IS110 family transposase n=1 Tax=Cutibacterium avidum TaxID=33010 RepID=UPI001ED95EA1|nr:IS110 family transposase [Cutibacterium avidum]